MARKTALRRLMKRLPLATEADRALQLEAEAEQSAEPARRPSPALRAVHARLGIVPDAEMVGTEVVEGEVATIEQDGAEPSPEIVTVSDGVGGELEVELAPDATKDEWKDALDEAGA